MGTWCFLCTRFWVKDLRLDLRSWGQGWGQVHFIKYKYKYKYFHFSFYKYKYKYKYNDF